MAHRRGIGALQSDGGMGSRRACSNRHFLGLGQIAAQRPFAVDMLARRQRGEDNGAVFGDFDRDHDNVDIRVAG